jgi:hypothetical protein
MGAGDQMVKLSRPPGTKGKAKLIDQDNVISVFKFVIIVHLIATVRQVVQCRKIIT